MACLSPVPILKKEWSVHSTRTQLVPCGNCVECLKRRSNQWVFRLNEELRRSNTASFLTLTYEDEKIPKSFNGLPTLDIKDHQDFMKRLRMKIKRDKTIFPHENEQKIKYYAVGEYGTKTERPHYHSIIFNLPEAYTLDNGKIEAVWRNGIIHQGTVSFASMHYVTKYLHKGRWQPHNELDDREKEFSCMSKGIGDNYCMPSNVRVHGNGLKNFVTFPGGNKVSLPRYYKDKLLTPIQRTEIQRIEEERQKGQDPVFTDEHQKRRVLLNLKRKEEKFNQLKRLGL
jgi:hypothetical protein